jgi:VWA domain containing CoxE-like protein
MIVILVSDLFEGGNRDEVLRRVAEMTAVGAQVIALLALSDDDAPAYHHHDNAAALGVLGFAHPGCVP